MVSWQSGNAPDSKSGEPSFPWRAGSNPVLTLRFEEVIIWMLTSFSFLLALHKKDYV